VTSTSSSPVAAQTGWPFGVDRIFGFSSWAPRQNSSVACHLYSVMANRVRSQGRVAERSAVVQIYLGGRGCRPNRSQSTLVDPLGSSESFGVLSWAPRQSLRWFAAGLRDDQSGCCRKTASRKGRLFPRSVWKAGGVDRTTRIPRVSQESLVGTVEGRPAGPPANGAHRLADSAPPAREGAQDVDLTSTPRASHRQMAGHRADG